MHNVVPYRLTLQCSSDDDYTVKGKEMSLVKGKETYSLLLDETGGGAVTALQCPHAQAQGGAGGGVPTRITLILFLVQPTVRAASFAGGDGGPNNAKSAGGVYVPEEQHPELDLKRELATDYSLLPFSLFLPLYENVHCGQSSSSSSSSPTALQAQHVPQDASSPSSFPTLQPHVAEVGGGTTAATTATKVVDPEAAASSRDNHFLKEVMLRLLDRTADRADVSSVTHSESPSSVVTGARERPVGGGGGPSELSESSGANSSWGKAPHVSARRASGNRSQHAFLNAIVRMDGDTVVVAGAPAAAGDKTTDGHTERQDLQQSTSDFILFGQQQQQRGGGGGGGGGDQTAGSNDGSLYGETSSHRYKASAARNNQVVPLSSLASATAARYQMPETSDSLSTGADTPTPTSRSAYPVSVARNTNPNGGGLGRGRVSDGHVHGDPSSSFSDDAVTDREAHTRGNNNSSSGVHVKLQSNKPTYTYAPSVARNYAPTGSLMMSQTDSASSLAGDIPGHTGPTGPTMASAAPPSVARKNSRANNYAVSVARVELGAGASNGNLHSGAVAAWRVDNGSGDSGCQSTLPPPAESLQASVPNPPHPSTPSPEAAHHVRAWPERHF